MLRYLLIGLCFCLSPWLGAQDVQCFNLLDKWSSAEMIPDGETPYYNEVWGFSHEGREYAVIGSRLGLHFFEITPFGKLKECAFVQGSSSGTHVTSRDFATHNGYLYAVCDQGFSTLQIINLQNLPSRVNVVYDSDTLIDRAHTLWIDEGKNKLFVGGPAGYAMKVFDIVNPINPQLIYTHTQQGYVHDMYVRNDTAFLNTGYEGLHIYVFNNWSTPYYFGAITGYTDAGYNHSGKWSKDGKWYVLADETEGKRLKIFDTQNFSDINEVSVFSSGNSSSTAHDPIIYGNYIFVAYYTDGLVVFDASDKLHPKKIAWFNPGAVGQVGLKGAWGVFIMPSGKVLLSDRQNGLYLLKFNEPPRINGSSSFGVYPNPLVGSGYFYYDNERNLNYSLSIYDNTGKTVKKLAMTDHFLQVNASEFEPGIYFYQFSGTDNNANESGKFIVPLD